MRRTLLAALLAAGLASPGLALAQQVPTNPGELDTLPLYINIAGCAGGNIDMSWLISATTFTNDGQYWVYASNTQWASSGDNTNYCPETNDTTNNVYARQIGTQFDVTTSSVSGKPFLASDIVAATNNSCSATTDVTIYLCAHWRNGSGVRSGWAHGTIVLSLRKPAVPTITGIQPGDGRLHVSLSSGTGGADTVTYKVIATAVDTTLDATPHDSGEQTGTVTVKGLKNGVVYNVVGYAFSAADNPSDASASMQGTPVPVNDFWDHYSGSGGRDNGGCESGPGGLLALLAAGGLALLRRRNA